MKIGIITIIDKNYGNRLQNYAVQEVLKQYGEVETIPFVKRDKQVFGRWIIKKLLYNIKHNFSYAWEEFDLKIKYGQYQIDKDEDKLCKHYDFVCLGSDQVWNTDWYESNPLRKKACLLSFFNREQKVCFAPSFGISEIGEEWKEWFSENIKDIPYLSVRETAGAQIIKKLTGRSAEVLIDPTLMLGAEEWMKIEKAPLHIDCEKKYVFTYFLGGITEKVQKQLDEVTNKYDCSVINIHEIIHDSFMNIGPSEFLYLVHHAFLIMTDSFHASVFSFIFEKPFLLFARSGIDNGMMSRMDTLIHTFGLERKYTDSGLENELLECDYSYGFNKLLEERKKVNDFLGKAFKSK